MAEFKLRPIFIEAERIVSVNPTYEIEMLTPSEINLGFVSVIEPRSVMLAPSGLFNRRETIKGTGVAVGTTEYLVRMPVEDFKSKYAEFTPE